MKAIGRSFYAELVAANIPVSQLPFSWGADGTLNYGDSVTEEQRTEIEAVYEAHDPAKPDPQSLRDESKAALDGSDVTVLRCFEAGVTLPAAWVDYRKQLRAIVSGAVASSLPTQPAYPAGT